MNFNQKVGNQLFIKEKKKKRKKKENRNTNFLFTVKGKIEVKENCFSQIDFFFFSENLIHFLFVSRKHQVLQNDIMVAEFRFPLDNSFIELWFNRSIILQSSKHNNNQEWSTGTCR